MQLPRLSPTALHWVTLAGSVFLGGVTSAIAQDGTPMQVIADLGDPTKRGAIVTGAVVAGVLAVCALVQRSVLPIVSARAVAQNAVADTMRARQTEVTPVDKPMFPPGSNPPKGGAQ